MALVRHRQDKGEHDMIRLNKCVQGDINRTNEVRSVSQDKIKTITYRVSRTQNKLDKVVTKSQNMSERWDERDKDDQLISGRLKSPYQNRTSCSQLLEERQESLNLGKMMWGGTQTTQTVNLMSGGEPSSQDGIEFCTAIMTPPHSNHGLIFWD